MSERWSNTILSSSGLITTVVMTEVLSTSEHHGVRTMVVNTSYTLMLFPTLYIIENMIRITPILCHNQRDKNNDRLNLVMFIDDPWLEGTVEYGCGDTTKQTSDHQDTEMVEMLWENYQSTKVETAVFHCDLGVIKEYNCYPTPNALICKVQGHSDCQYTCIHNYIGLAQWRSVQCAGLITRMFKTIWFESHCDALIVEYLWARYLRQPA